MKKILFIISLVGFVLSSCDDVIVPELDDAHVEMITPLQDDSTNNAVITFWWKEIEEADRYRIQIVRPSFANVSEIEVDTFVTGLTFYTSLESGDYEWVIRAVNSVSETENPIIYRMYVSQDIDLQDFKPELVYPTNSVGVQNNTSVNFRWDGHPSATSYEILLINNTDNLSDVITVPAQVSSPENGLFDSTFSFSSNRNFTWSVRAFNSAGASLFSEEESFKVDTSSVF